MPFAGPSQRTLERWSQGAFAALVVLGLPSAALAGAELKESAPAEAAPQSELPALPSPRAPQRHMFFNPGFLASMSPGIAKPRESDGKQIGSVAQAYGVELSAAIYGPRSLVFYGPFAQAQYVSSFNGDHGRYAVGVQGGWTVLSSELGLSYRSQDHLHAGTAQLHLGLICSFVFVNVGGQFGVPLSTGTSSKSAYPVEGSLVFAFKIPVMVW